MTHLKFSTTVESKAHDTSVIPLVNGQFLILTDTLQLTYDYNGKRIILGDITELNTEEERQALLVPISKFYFVKSTGVLWRYNGGNWIKWDIESLSDAIDSLSAENIPMSPSDSTSIADTISNLTGQPKLVNITFPANWSGDGPYSQTFSLDGTSNYTKVDLQPDPTAIGKLLEAGVTGLWIENSSGVLTAWAYGGAPKEALTMQATIMEVRS